MRARVTVRLKEGVLDPQGEAIQGALAALGFAGVRGVRVGKVVELDLDAADAAVAKEAATNMADKLLANPVIEAYEIEVLSK